MKLKRKSEKPSKPERKKREKKPRTFKTRKISKDETIHAAPARRAGQVSPGAFIINQLGKSNPNVRRIHEALKALPRQDLEDRLAIIYCNILGLAGMESQ